MRLVVDEPEEDGPEEVEREGETEVRVVEEGVERTGAVVVRGVAVVAGRGAVGAVGVVRTLRLLYCGLTYEEVPRLRSYTGLLYGRG